MANTLYLSQLAEARMHSLPSAEYDQVFQSLNHLQDDPLANSRVLSGPSDLRIARTGDYQVVLRYVPDKQAILVTDIRTADLYETLAA